MKLWLIEFNFMYHWCNNVLWMGLKRIRKLYVLNHISPCWGWEIVPVLFGDQIPIIYPYDSHEGTLEFSKINKSCTILSLALVSRSIRYLDLLIPSLACNSFPRFRELLSDCNLFSRIEVCNLRKRSTHVNRGDRLQSEKANCVN